MRKFNRFLALGLGLVAAACGDDVTVVQPPEPPPPPPPGIRSVTVAPNGATITAGASLQFTAAVVTDPGAATPTIAWSTTAPATVGSISAAGLFTSVATAPTTSVGITATATSGTSVASGNATLNIAAAPACAIQGVSVTPTTATLSPGQSLTAVATVAGTNCTPAQLANVTWSLASGNPAHVTVGATTGVITITSAATPGVAVVRATSGVDATKSATIAITIVVPVCEIQGVAVSPATATLSPGQSLTAVATVTGANCTAAELTNVTWSLASGNPAHVTVGATTGVITITSAATPGVAVVRATSGVDATKSATIAITIVVPDPATVSIESITYVPGPCPPSCSGSIPVNLLNVFGQIEVTANVNAGGQQLSRLDVLIGGQVVASQTFPGTVAPSDPEAAAQAPVQITLSANTAQVRRPGGAGTPFVPVVFNGNQLITLNLYVVGNPVPVASNAVPVVMNNLDVLVVTPGTDGPSLTRTAVVAPAPVTVGGVTWWKGSQTASGNFIAYSNTLPTAYTWSAGNVCATTPTGTITGTPAAGLTITGVYTCAGVEGQNFLGAAGPASALSYAPAVTGPDGTILATAGTLAYARVGTAFTIPTGATTSESRWNLTSVPAALIPNGWIDNEGPSVDIASSTTLLFAGGPPAVGGRAVAFNGGFDQWWISTLTFATCVPASTKTADPGGVFTPNCATSGYLAAADGGVGLKPGFPVARLVVTTGTTDACTGATVAGAADLAETVTSAAPDGYRICTYAEDRLDNASSTTLAAASPLQPSNGTNKSNRFGVDKGAPSVRVAGTATGQALTSPLVPATVPTGAAPAGRVAATANTTIFGPAALPNAVPVIDGPFDPNGRWGLEALDTRSGFNQNAVTGFPAVQTLARLAPAGATSCATFTNAMTILLADTWVRTNVLVPIDCGQGVGYYTYNGYVIDRAGNASSVITRNFAVDQFAAPNITGLGFATAFYTPGAAAPFGFSANDDLEIIDGTLRTTQYIATDGAGNTVGANGHLRYPLGTLTPLGTRWDATLTNVLNGAVASIPYFIFRVDESCTAAGVPYAACTAPGTIPSPPAGAPPAPPASAPYYTAPVSKTAANYLTPNPPFVHPTTNAGYLPTAMEANVGDVAITPSVGPITAPMLGSQFSPSAGIAEPWSAADLLSWDLATVGANTVATHVASTSIQVPFFDHVSLWRINAAGEVVFCGTFPAPVLTDNGSNRFWTYTMPTPTTGPCISPALAFTGPAPTGQWRAGGARGGALLLTPARP